ncbi:ATP-binding protein [Chakrabartyella piscis]|uniref:ATP-binding protein n=1 Tax=Chakrabartyella piscis TaxID=2918914 RepID=UPI002958BA9A|nr:ATP-binding protein [Chakrabartyella piscis]
MATRTEIFRELMREYDMIRTEKAGELRQRKEALYTSIPRLAEIERSLALLGTKMARRMLMRGANPEEIVAELRLEQNALEMERQELLASKQFSPKLLELEYECAACQDTGFIGTERCLCLKKRLMDKMYDQSNVRKIIEMEHFDHFDFRYYSKEAWQNETKTPFENAQKIYARAIRFTEEFPKGEHLLLTGGTGLGKTFLCNCMAKELLEKGNMVLYLTSSQLFKKLEEQRFNKNNDDEEAKEWDQELLEADLLIIDDLGTEFSTVFTATELFRIVNDRILANKSMVISTNLSMEELMNSYSDRVTSRLFGEFILLHFYGEDIRLQKKFGK